MATPLGYRQLALVAFVLMNLASVWCHLNHQPDNYMPTPQEGRPVHDHERQAPDHQQAPNHQQARFDRNHIQNQEHIMDHYEGVMNKPESEMSEEELQFHYFKLHDYDNNNKLDGIEIINAMTHHHKGDKPEEDQHNDDRMPDEELITVIDGIMTDEDLNKDGYIDYSEFVSAQRSQGDEGTIDAEALHVPDAQDPQQPPIETN